MWGPGSWVQSALHTPLGYPAYLARPSSSTPARSHLCVLGLREVVLGACMCFILFGCAAFASNPESSATQGVFADDEVVVLDLMQSTSSVWPSEVTEAVHYGKEAALYAEGNSLLNGRKIRQVVPASAVTPASADEVIRSALKANGNLLTILGPFDMDVLAAALESGATESENLVLFAPMTENNIVHMWNWNAYFTFPTPRTQLLALLRFIVVKRCERRLGFMYLSGAGHGEEELSAMLLWLKTMGHSAPIVYAQPVGSPFNESAFEEFMKSEPLSVVLYGLPEKHTADFFEALVTRWPQEKGHITVAATSTLLSTLFPLYSSLHTRGLSVVNPLNILFSSSVPLPTDSRFEFVKSFSAEMQKYLTDHAGKVPYKDVRIFLSDPVLGYHMISGWTAGKLLLQALNRRPTVNLRSAFQELLFEQSRYTIGGDLIIGDYGGICTPMMLNQADAGVACYCNQGGRMVTVSSLESVEENRGSMSALFPIPEADFVYPFKFCYPSLRDIRAPVVLLSIHVLDERGDYMFDQQYHMLEKVLPTFPSETHEFTAFQIQGLKDDLQDILHSTSRNHMLHAVSGFFPDDLRQLTQLLVIDPVGKASMPRLKRPNAMYLCTTLEQEFYVMAMLLDTELMNGRQRGSSIYASVRSSTKSDDIVDLLQQTLEVFEMSLKYRLVQDSESIVEGIAPIGTTFLVGIYPSDVQQIVNFLRVSPAARVVITFDDLTVNYRWFMEALQKSSPSITDRVLFSTNLPNWADRSMGSEMHHELRRYFEHLGERTPSSPASLRAFLAANILFVLSEQMRVVTSTSMQIFLYKVGFLEFGGLAFGPFLDCNSTSAGDSTECLQNYGARNISVRSFTSILNPSVGYLTDPVTPNMVYSKEEDEEDIMVWGARLILLLLGIGAGVATGLFVFFYWYRNMWKSVHAPKDASKPLTIMFTDIESSTTLWASVPSEMSSAVIAHHHIIRHLIVKHKCYEVKTIGDSFMIASANAFAVSQLSRAIQIALFEYDWGTSAIDEAYLLAERRKERGLADFVSSTLHLSEREYSSRWNGLRVRIGIHTGMADIRFDSVASRYDYYGDAPNVAARTEGLGCGGEILLTEGTWNALSEAQRDYLGLQSLGPSRLRGVPHPIEIYQLNALSTRSFPSLLSRLQYGPPLGTQELTSATEIEASQHNVLPMEGGVITETGEMMEVLLGPFSLKRSVEVLCEVCGQFHIAIPPRLASVPLEAYRSLLLRTVATQIHTFVSMRKWMRGEDVGGSVPGRAHHITSVGRADSALHESGFRPVGWTAGLFADATVTLPLDSPEEPQMRTLATDRSTAPMMGTEVRGEHVGGVSGQVRRTRASLSKLTISTLVVDSFGGEHVSRPPSISSAALPEGDTVASWCYVSSSPVGSRDVP